MIGIFDSGVGGLTVLRALRARMPDADFVYFGDTENAPYGNKSRREIAELVAMALLRLRAAGATDIVNACNTASAAIHDALLDLLRINVFSVVGMLEPTVEALVERHKQTAIFCTRATGDSGIYQKQCAARGVRADVIVVPTLAGLIERGAPDDELLSVVRPAVQDAVARGAEVLSLSCTHFPLVRDMFEACLREDGSAAGVFDPADAVAAEAARVFSSDGAGSLRFMVSGPAEVFAQRVAELFPDLPHRVEDAGSIYWALKAK